MRKLLLLAVLSTLPVVACGQTPRSSESSTASVNRPSENDVYNFHTVNSALFRSGEVKDDQIDTLLAAGVKTIVSLQDASERPEAEAAGIGFRLDAMSGASRPTVSQIQKALDYINDSNLQPVLVHCTYGADRTGIVIAAYRMTHDGWSKADAIAEMYRFGHSTSLSWWDSVLGQFE